MNDTTTEINKDTFWGLIREAKDACGQDMSAMMEYLKERLVSMGTEQAQNFHDITQAYEDLACKYGLWDAAEIIKEYFRCAAYIKNQIISGVITSGLVVSIVGLHGRWYFLMAYAKKSFSSICWL